jgi:hypothetical protein
LILDVSGHWRNMVRIRRKIIGSCCCCRGRRSRRRKVDWVVVGGGRRSKVGGGGRGRGADGVDAVRHRDGVRTSHWFAWNQLSLLTVYLSMGGGRNVEFHYYDWQFFSERRKWLLSWSQLQHHNVENGFWVDHYIEKNEKNIEKISFVWISHFDYLWRKYLWHFGVNKNFLTWLNLT